MGYQESFVFTNKDDVNANHDDIEKILTIFKKYGVRCKGDWIATCACKLVFNKEIGEFKKGMEMLVISGDRGAQREIDNLFDIYDDEDEIEPINYTNEEMKLIKRVKMTGIENYPEILKAEENGDVTVKELRLVSDKVFMCEAKICFPNFQGDGRERTFPHLIIETTEERYNKFFEDIEKNNANFWSAGDYKDLCEAITQMVAAFVLGEENYYKHMCEMIANSPDASNYEAQVRTITDARNIITEGEESVMNNEELIMKAVGDVSAILCKEGIYEIQFGERIKREILENEMIITDSCAFQK